MASCDSRETLEQQLVEALDWYSYRDRLLSAVEDGAAKAAQARVNHLINALGAHCVKHACILPKPSALDVQDEIVCPLWNNTHRRFRARHYHTWKRPCSICNREVVVSRDIEDRMRSGKVARLICELCPSSLGQRL